MGVVKYAPGIEFVKGSLAKPKKKDGHKCGDYLIGTHREAATLNTAGCTRLYIRKENAYERSTPVLAEELAQRQRFAAVSRAVATRSKDLMKINDDQVSFLAQKNEPGGYKTMKSYLWSLELATYDAAHSNG